MVYKFATLALAGLVLAGCEMAEITQPVVDVTRKPALAPERVTGLSDTVLRSFVVEADTRKELSGVPCSVESGEFSAQVTTPVQMRLPRVAGRPSQAVVTCQYGDQTDRVVAAPTLDGVVVAGASPVGLILGAVTAGMAIEKDEWAYPPYIEATFKPIETEE